MSNELAQVFALLAIVCAGLKANRWYQIKRREQARVSSALKNSIMYREAE